MTQLLLIGGSMAMLFVGLLILKQAGGAPSRKRRRRAPYTRKEKIMLTAGWIIAAIGGVILTVTFSTLALKSGGIPLAPP